MRKKIIAAIASASVMFSVASFAPLVSAATTIVVTPANTQGWSIADTRPGGAVTFVADPTSPAPTGALQLTTNATTTAKAQYLHAANTPLINVTDLSYYTKQVSAAFPGGDPSYQLIVCLNGAPTATTCPGFTTLVFEPYQNPTQGAVTPGVWQKWNVSGGLFWSTRTVICSNGTVVGTPGGPSSYTLAQIKTMCPSAVVSGYGVNIGSNNPSYVVRTDLFNFNGTVYNFELTNVPTKKSQCKNGGYVNYTDASGKAFTSEKQCKKFVSHEHDKDDGDKNEDKQGQHNDD